MFGGTNDSWANAPVGSLKYADWQNEDLYCVLPAFCYFIKALKAQRENVNMICLLNAELKEEIADGFEKACQHYGVFVIRLQEVDKQFGHPTIKGMAQIAQQIMESL